MTVTSKGAVMNPEPSDPVERADERAHGDSQRELPVKLPGDAADERRRNKDRG